MNSVKQPKGHSGFTPAQIIGENFPSNNRSMHAPEFETRHLAPLRAFGDDAAPLVACLETAPVRAAFAQYAKSDDTAAMAQKSYKWLSTAIVIPTVMALGVCAILALISPAWMTGNLAFWFGGQPSDYDGWIRLGLPWAICILLAATPIAKAIGKPGKLFEDWHYNRGGAEAMRREIFSRVMSARPSEPVPAPPNGIAADSWLLMLKLEYFRRWQVEVQYAYFRERPKQEWLKLQTRAKWATRIYQGLIGLMVALLFLMSIAGWGEQEYSPALSRLGAFVPALGYLEQLQTDYILFFALALAGVAAAYFIVTSQYVNPLQNMARCKNMEANYKQIVNERLDDARAAAMRGDQEMVQHYIDRVHSMMSIETNDWVRLKKLDDGLDVSTYNLDPAANLQTSPPAPAAPQLVKA